MARTDTLGHFLGDVADSIRSKTKKSGSIACKDFDTEIRSIIGEAELQTKSVAITQNGTSTIEPDSGYDGLTSISLTTNVHDTLHKIPLIIDGVIQVPYAYTKVAGSATGVGELIEDYNDNGYVYATSKIWSAYRLTFGALPLQSGAKVILEYKKENSYTGSNSQYGNFVYGVTVDGTDTETNIIATRESQTTLTTLTININSNCDDFFLGFINLADGSNYANYGISIYNLWIEIDKNTIALQNKEIEITSNTDTIVRPDANYVGLNNIVITTKVPSGSGTPIISTTETVVGTWVDDKPLYMKTITGTITTNVNGGYEEILDPSISDSLSIIFLGENSFFEDSNGKVCPINYAEVPTNGSTMTIVKTIPNKDTRKVWSNAYDGMFPVSSNVSYTINIYYVKTNDTAVSDPTLLGGHNYSTTEHVVDISDTGVETYERTITESTSYRNLVPVAKSVQHGINNIDKIWLVDGSFFYSSGDNNNFRPVQYWNHNQDVYRQHAHTSVDKNQLNLYVGDWLVTQGTIYHYITLRYTKNAIA